MSKPFWQYMVLLYSIILRMLIFMRMCLVVWCRKTLYILKQEAAEAPAAAEAAAEAVVAVDAAVVEDAVKK